MDRETLKNVAAGHFALSEPSIDVDAMKTYVAGALFAYDTINKLNKAKDDAYKRTVQGSNQTSEAPGNRNNIKN